MRNILPEHKGHEEEAEKSQDRGQMQSDDLGTPAAVRVNLHLATGVWSVHPISGLSGEIFQAPTQKLAMCNVASGPGSGQPRRGNDPALEPTRRISAA